MLGSGTRLYEEAHVVEEWNPAVMAKALAYYASGQGEAAAAGFPPLDHLDVEHLEVLHLLLQSALVQGLGL